MMKTKRINFFWILALSLIFGYIYLITYCKSEFPVKVTVVLSADQKDEVQLFYSTLRGFNEEESINRQFESGTELQTLVFDLPAQMIHRIRIDPGNKSDSVWLSAVKIETASDEKTFSGADILEHFEFINLIIPRPTGADELLLLAENQDPQLIYKSDLGDDFLQRDETLFLKRKIAIGFSYLILVLVFVFFGGKIGRWAEKKNNYLKNIRFEKLNTAYIINYLKANKIIFLSSLFIGIFAFGYELFNFSLSIDDEMASFLSASEMKSSILTGRWFFYLLNLFFHPYSVMPFYTTALAIFCIAASASLFILNQKGNLPSKLVFLIIFISSPVHSYYLAFNLSFYYSLGMLLTTISFLTFKSAFNKESVDIRNYFATIFLLALSVALYQSMLAFFMVFVAYLMFEVVSQKQFHKIKIRKIILSTIVVCLLSLLVYKIGDYFSRYYFLGSAYLDQTDYLDKFIGWQSVPLLSNIYKLFELTFEYLTGLKKTDAYLGIAEQSILILFLYLTVLIFTSGISLKMKLITQVSLIILLLSPFVLVYLNGAALPVRAMMSLPLMIALLWFSAYKRANAIVRRLMLLFVLLILINNTYINTRLFYASKTAWEADKDMASRIAERIYRLDPKVENGLIRVAFIGDYQHTENHLFLQSDVFGASFFHWDPGSASRKLALLKTIGIDNLDSVNEDDLKQYDHEISEMPSWPFKGSVALFDGVVVVKLSE